MSKIESYDLFDGRKDKVKVVITRLREFEPPEGYYLADSFGKDSCVILRLTEMSGVKFDAHHNLTTIDPPPLIHFGKKHHPNTEIHHPDVPFFTEMVNRGFPMRMRRWCCADYKEQGGDGRFIITGVRAEESRKRAGRKVVEICYRNKTKKYMNPIIDWTEKEVWAFIKDNNIPYCDLYDKGFERLGCVLCPLAKKSAREREALMFPKMKEAWRQAFIRLYKRNKALGRKSIERWKDGDEMFEWWLKSQESEDADQTVLFE